MRRARRAAVLALAALARTATAQTPLLQPDFAFSCVDANATRCEAALAGCVRACRLLLHGGGRQRKSVFLAHTTAFSARGFGIDMR
jgi:hypothetical protein